MFPCNISMTHVLIDKDKNIIFCRQYLICLYIMLKSTCITNSFLQHWSAVCIYLSIPVITIFFAIGLILRVFETILVLGWKIVSLIFFFIFFQIELLLHRSSVCTLFFKQGAQSLRVGWCDNPWITYDYHLYKATSFITYKHYH